MRLLQRGSPRTLGVVSTDNEPLWFIGIFIAVVAALLWLWRWHLKRSLTPDAVAGKPMTSVGKVFAAALVFSLVVAVVLVGAFPQGWLAQLLDTSPSMFCLVAIAPAAAVAFILEKRGVKLHRDRTDDA